MRRSPSPERFHLIVTAPSDDLAQFARDVKTGLTASPKFLPCRYFYDREGSRLFEEICQLPEYYLTRAEREILSEHAEETIARWSHDVALVELGSGSATKTRVLIDALLRRQERLQYVPVDISRAALEESARALLEHYPTLSITAIAGEYHDGLERLQTSIGGAKLILWLGSSVGNFERGEAAEFLRRVRATMTADDRLLIGIDLRKDRTILERAYDDASGVTARFNLNLLARINRQLGGHFDLEAFRHRALYNEEVGRIEMYLVSARAQRVVIDRLNMTIAFAPEEAIHTENSYKYSLAEIDALAEAAGLRIEQQWFDAGHRFSVNLMAPS